MANLSENPQWVDGIYQIETSDPVAGGPDGVSNRQAKELASRTSYLKKEQEKTGSDLATHAAASDPHTQYAPKENPSFTGTPKAPTPATDSNSQQIATTAFVRSAGATKLAKDQNGADIQDRELFNRNLGSSRAYSSSISIGGSAGLWTTAEFIGWLESQGAFVHAYWVCRGSWSYSHNKIISDTECGQIPLAGSVVEVMGQNGATTIRVTTPSTTPAGLSDSANAQFTYVYNGFDYSPGWRRDYNTKNKPTAADIGALSEKAVAQAAAKLATPRTINGVPFDGTANITLTPANLGLGNVMNKGEFGWGGKAIPLPFNSKIIDYFKVDTPSGLYWCNTTIADRPPEFSDCLLLWSVIQHNDFYGTLIAISFTPIGDDNRVRTATINTIHGLWGEWQYNWAGSKKGGVANALGVTLSKPSNINEYLHQLSQQQEMGSRALIDGSWKTHISVRHLGGVPENGDKNNGLYGMAIVEENMLSNSYDISIYKQNNGAWLKPVKIYHSDNKPTASDIGAITKSDADINYVRQGSLGVIYKNDDLAWNSPTGAYLKDNGGDTSLIWHMGLNTGSASAAQFHFGYSNSGLMYRSSRDNSGFEKPWARIYSDQDKPTAAEIGALSLNEFVGIPMPWPQITAPSGWLKCSGQTFDKSIYPLLAQAYPAGILPDLRGEFIRGWDDGRGVDTDRKLMSSQSAFIPPIPAVGWGRNGVIPGAIEAGRLMVGSGSWEIEERLESLNGAGNDMNLTGDTHPRNIAFNYIVRAA
ncbi:phage tail protein [Pectobacterium sp. 21LCBS03]|uniref:phage tail protein n=1 Tax=Pectobacterium sp. 21LCBS03 TaxID=2935858 RepID=UPI00200EE8A1|nr:phage tail protein [Pectobacterium sp. 21LCBS03]UPY93628.1 tail fiber protein [Pectobacterium sp. 21LCBS03]